MNRTVSRRPSRLLSALALSAGVLLAAHELAIQVPTQLSVAGFDDTYIARIVWPRLTTVHQPSYDLAFAATDLLLQSLKNGDAPKIARLPHKLIRRESTAAPFERTK